MVGLNMDLFEILLVAAFAIYVFVMFSITRHLSKPETEKIKEEGQTNLSNYMEATAETTKETVPHSQEGKEVVEEPEREEARVEEKRKERKKAEEEVELIS